MDRNAIMNQINLLLQENKVAEAEAVFLNALAQALSEDAGAALQLLNELLGFYRETGQTGKSYETYLRGEISTYSDKMLDLYGRYVVEHAKSGRNLAYEIMSHTAEYYGYEGVEAAEAALKKNNPTILDGKEEKNICGLKY